MSSPRNYLYYSNMSNSPNHPKGSPRSAHRPNPVATHHQGTAQEPPIAPHTGSPTGRMFGLPELAHGDLALLTSQQEIVIASGTTVQGYTPVSYTHLRA